MAGVVAPKIKYKVQRRDGLPKCASADDWLRWHKEQDKTPRLGGVCWMDSQLVLVARIDGHVHALPFSKFTPQSVFRDKLTPEDRTKYDEYYRQAMAGAFNAFVAARMAESPAF
jgi:hypothetical protein